MHYRSSLHLLGLPLIHIAIGPSENDPGNRGFAKGWIAIGDVALGILLAIGGLAAGGVAVGGISLGVLALAGFSLGVWSLGGLALGVYALGGGGGSVGSRGGIHDSITLMVYPNPGPLGFAVVNADLSADS